MNELTINLEADSKKPLYEQIYEYIKLEIQTGNLSSHEKLPSARALASHLQVSRSTIDLAYSQLVSEGYVEAVPCKGYFVSQMEELYFSEKFQRKESVEENAKESTENSSGVSKSKPQEDIWKIDFKLTGIDLDNFPYNIWRKLSKNVLSYHENDIFSLGESSGEYCLRQSICKYLFQSRGVNCTPEQVVVGAGSEYLLFLIQKMLGNQMIAMESPTYVQAYRVLESLGHHVKMISMDTEGMKVEELSSCDAKLAYVMPSHQFPLGTIMPLKRRMELLKWASKERERFIIEDDYDSEFRYKGKPIPALKAYDREDKVIYLGTFSKAIAPAIRISYMVLPRQLCGVFEEKCGVYSSTVSRIDQMVVCDFMNQGYFGRHLNKMRGIYKAKHDALLAGLKNISSIKKISGENAGVHMVIAFGTGTEAEWMKRAENVGIKVYGLSGYFVNEKQSNPVRLLLGYANLKEEEIIQACEMLKKVWE